MNLKFASLILGSLLVASQASKALDMVLTTDEDGGNNSSVYQTLIMDGAIFPEDAKILDTILKKRFKLGSRTVFLLTSPGGALEAVPKLVETIVSHSNRFYKKFGKPLLFAVNFECDSACNILTAGVTSKRKPEALEMLFQNEATFLFHRPREMDERGQLRDYADPQAGAQAFQRMLQAYSSYGVSTAWIEREMSRFSEPQGFVLSAQELCLSNSGVIPVESCTKLSVDKMLEKIDQIYYENRVAMEDEELRNSISRRHAELQYYVFDEF